MNKKIRMALLACIVCLVCSLNATAGEKLEFKNGELNNPWNMEELKKTPKYTMEEAKDGVRAVVLEAMDYRGHRKQVFAYYSTPGILKGDPSLDKNLPAVVCAHGGGGRAFEEWVKIWAERGYAAICVDQRGYGANKVPLEFGFTEGGTRSTPYFTAHEDRNEDWFYQAIGDVVCSHSLILSRPEVDPTRSAIVGISWGGIITTLVAGLDDRFKVASPVYGCGFLYDTGSMAPQIDEKSVLTQTRWRTEYDPALYVCNAKIPVLFVNGTNDTHFYTDQWQATTDLAKNVSRSMRFEMKHGHGPGWTPKEIYSFVGKHLGMDEGYSAPKFTKIKNKNGQISCTVKGAMPGYRAYLIYTTGDDYSHKDKWVKTEVPVLDDVVVADVESDYMQWFIAVEYPDEANFSSEIFFR